MALKKSVLITVAIFQLLAASAALPGEVDRFCWKSPVQDPATGRAEDICRMLSVERGSVIYTVPEFRSLVIGKYVSVAQSLVPRTEAPIRDLRSPGGWRMVVSSFLPRDKESDASLRIRFFGPDGKLRGTDQALMTLEDIEVGHFFGNSGDIVGIQSNEEHSYNSTTSIWLLPQRGKPKELIDKMNATLGKFSDGGSGTRPGVWISRQTYDGVHAGTKGWVDEFWVWNSAKKSLTLEKK